MTLFDEITGPNKDKIKSFYSQWNDDGVLIVRNYANSDLIEDYVLERDKLIKHTDIYHSGWRDPCPYLRVQSMKELCLDKNIVKIIKHLMGGNDPGLHLCLTGYKSTERQWHMDGYLNPEGVGEHYIAVWIALDDIDPNSGPFQYVPGSHKWPVIERSKIFQRMRNKGQEINQDTWPSDTQDWVADACDEEIVKMDAKVSTYVPRRGDVLFWHAHLVHRGSKPVDPNIERRALIAHYSSINHRPDMKDIRTHHNGSHYFHFGRYE